MNRLKLAELTSGVGALVLGIGLGALFAQWFERMAVAITLAGLTAHAFGMWDKHQLESQAVKGESLWSPSCTGSAGYYWPRSLHG